MIDIHAHLCFPDFDGDRDAVAAECGRVMDAVIVGSARHDEGLCALELCRRHPKMFPCLGYHPVEGGPDPGPITELIRRNRDSVVGIGEVGLDHHWERDPAKRKVQARVFGRFIGLASELKKPLVVHSWDAEPECFAMVKGFEGDVVFHCFSGTKELAAEILDAGFFISFSTQVLFSKGHRKLAKAVPLERMTLETDSPFLSPLKYVRDKGMENALRPGFDPKRNYPWNIALSAEKIAEIKGTESAEVLQAAKRNAVKVFGLRL